MLTQKTSGPSVLQTGRVLFLPLGAIRPNPAQPRSVFDAAGLQELAASIRQYGVLQPLSVRKKGSGFELVAGERRLRAAGLAGLREVPCLLVTADDQDAGLLALVENLQRRDLDYIEQAQGLARLMQQYHLTQEQAARRVGKSQSAIANKLRLLRHSDPVLAALREAQLTERHARALLRLPDEETKLAAIRQIREKQMSVARTESYVESLLRSPAKKKSPQVGAFLNSLSQSLAKIQLSGIPAVSERRETDSQIVVTITIPK